MQPYSEIISGTEPAWAAISQPQGQERAEKAGKMEKGGGRRAHFAHLSFNPFGVFGSKMTEL